MQTTGTDTRQSVVSWLPCRMWMGVTRISGEWEHHRRDLSKLRYRKQLEADAMANITRVKTKAGETRYRVRVVTGHTPEGKAITTMRTFHTAKEATDAARKWEVDIRHGTAGDSGKMRTNEFMRGWLARAEKRVEPSTMHGYREVTGRYLLPGLGAFLLRDLSPARLQAWIDTLPTPDTAHRCKRTLHICLADAVNLGLLALNPADRVKTPRKPPSPATAWSLEETRRFLAAAKDHAYQPYWLLSLRLPLRPSEVLGLHWENVDLDNGTLAVVEGRATVANTSYDGGPKSDAGNRIIDLPDDMVVTLRAHRTHQRERRLALGDQWREHGLVCAGEMGQPIGHRNLTRAFKRLCGVAGVKDIRLYDLRHTAISLMAAAGADIKAISEVAGHANVLFTRNVYQHINRNQRRAAIGALTDALGEPAPAGVEAVSERLL